jgi:hypothetical protein
MDDENKDLEDPMETGMLDDMINYNIDVWETQNELVENHQTLEENKPKKKSKLRKILFIILWVFWVLFCLGWLLCSYFWNDFLILQKKWVQLI